jgi:hypothetical protein
MRAQPGARKGGDVKIEISGERHSGGGEGDVGGCRCGTPGRIVVGQVVKRGGRRRRRRLVPIGILRRIDVVQGHWGYIIRARLWPKLCGRT